MKWTPHKDFWKIRNIPEPVPEFKFDRNRKWRFDFCWPVHMAALEVEGGTWISGRHNRGSGYRKDLEKYNSALLQGWKVLRIPTDLMDKPETELQILILLKR